MKRLSGIVFCLMGLSLSFVSLQLEAEPQRQAQDKSNEGYATNDGVKIWYRVEGSKTSNAIPLLMIHGGPGATARPFEKTIGPGIARNRQVIYMDYRGAGRSDRPKDPNKYSFEILASDAEAIRKHLKIDKWSVFGHSNGSATAITYTHNYSSRVASLILCSPMIGGESNDMGLIYKVALTPADKYEQVRAIYKSDQSSEAKYNKYFDLIDRETRYRLQYFNPDNSTVLNKIQADLGKELGKGIMEPALIEGLMLNGFFEFDAFKLVNQLDMPALVLLGRFDSEISNESAMKFALTIPDGYVEMLNRSGHHPYLEETEASIKKINNFLSRHAGKWTSK